MALSGVSSRKQIPGSLTLKGDGLRPKFEDVSWRKIRNAALFQAPLTTGCYNGHD